MSNAFYVLRDKDTGFYIGLDEYACLYPTLIKAKAARFTLKNAEKMIYDGIEPRIVDIWPNNNRLNLEYVYVPELDEAQLRLV